MGEHGSVGHTIDLTHHVDGERCSIGDLLVSQCHQGIEGVHLFTTLLHTLNNGFLKLFVHGRTLLESNKRIDCSTDLRIIDLGFELIQRNLIGLLVCLLTQALEHTKLEVLKLSLISRINLCFPCLTVQQEAMHLAGLRVDHVRGNTHPLLLPDHMVEVHRMIQAHLHQGAFHEVEHPIDLTTQPIVLGFNTLTTSLVHSVFIDFFHACNRI